jgi:hypothetical protein
MYDLSHLEDRAVPLLPLWKDGRWTYWLPVERGQYIETHPLDAAASVYLAKSAARNDDVAFAFSNFIWQHASWPAAAEAAKSLEGRLDNLCTSIAKIDFFWRHRANQSAIEVSECVATELEYLSVVTRSILDDLQKVIADVWERKLRPRGHKNQRSKKGLSPSSMADVCLQGEEPKKTRTAGEMVERFGLPRPLAAFYAESAPFLDEVRRLRNSVVHASNTTGPISIVEKGFVTDRRDRLCRTFPRVWSPEHAYNDNTYSLRPLLGYLADRTLRTCSDACAALAACVSFPPAVAPGYGVFIRTPHGAALMNARAALSGDPWWPEQ